MPQSIVLREANNCAVRKSKGAPLMDRESISMHGGAVAIPANIDLGHRRDIEQSFADIAAHAGALLALGHVAFDVVGRRALRVTMARLEHTKA